MHEIPRDIQDARRRSLASRIAEIVIAAMEDVGNVRAALFELSALSTSETIVGTEIEIDGDAIVSELAALGELAASLFPKKLHPRKSEFIGRPCPACPPSKSTAATIVDVEFGRGSEPVLICGLGHRTLSSSLPDPD